MKTYSISELFHMTRAELFALHDRIVAEIAPLPEFNTARISGLVTLRLIRYALARKAPVP